MRAQLELRLGNLSLVFAADFHIRVIDHSDRLIERHDIRGNPILSDVAPSLFHRAFTLLFSAIHSLSRHFIVSGRSR